MAFQLGLARNLIRAAYSALDASPMNISEVFRAQMLISVTAMYERACGHAVQLGREVFMGEEAYLSFLGAGKTSVGSL